MKCLCCKMGGMDEAKNTYFAQLNNCYVVIENIPCYECRQCGDVYYKSSVLEEIDLLLEKIKKISSKIFIMDYN